MAGSLGTFTFVQFDNARALDGAPETLKERTEVIQRPGVDGTAIRVAGLKGNPFEMRSGVDVGGISPQAALDAAAVIHNQYALAIGGNPLQLIWRGFDYDTLNVRYVVLGCRVVETFPVNLIVGGTASGSRYGAFIRAVWNLIPVVKT